MKRIKWFDELGIEPRKPSLFERANATPMATVIDRMNTHSHVTTASPMEDQYTAPVVVDADTGAVVKDRFGTFQGERATLTIVDDPELVPVAPFEHVPELSSSDEIDEAIVDDITAGDLPSEELETDDMPGELEEPTVGYDSAPAGAFGEN